MLHLHSFFHLNLAYSAIDEEDRARVVERCYWPLLRLARRRNLPFGIELSGYTLENVASIDPDWVVELASLVNDGPCELIGCGYAQVIGPLVPREVTSANLRIGHAVYQDLLGVTPKVALLNEQAYSTSLVSLYQDAGYKAIIMEWDNPGREHPDWDPEWRYLPQRARGAKDAEIGLVWNKTISFQKFQRYAHGELELDELLAYIRSHRSDQLRVFPVYGNDVEVFDFRPGRYKTEASLHDEGEWVRIDKLYAALARELEMTFILPSEVLKLVDQPGANKLLSLETAAQPTPVKKQAKYNLVRWAVSGRDDLKINTRCYQLYEAMLAGSEVSDADWRELCYLWSSDFRTHITEKRWTRYLERLDRFGERWSTQLVGTKLDKRSASMRESPTHNIEVQRNDRFINIHGERLDVRLNCLRGLALNDFVDNEVSTESICGTLPHGYFDDIGWGADYFSGHLVLEMPGHPKITDLVPVEPEVIWVDDGVIIACSIETPLGSLQKRWSIDERHRRLTLSYRFDWSEPFVGSCRVGHITLRPDTFDADTCFYKTHNGGDQLEAYWLNRQNFEHGRPVSFLVSARHAIGLTGGIVEIGDTNKILRITHKPSQAALVGMISNQEINGSHLIRLAYSVRELDDTSKPSPLGPLELDFQLNILKANDF